MKIIGKHSWDAVTHSAVVVFLYKRIYYLYLNLIAIYLFPSYKFMCIFSHDYKASFESTWRSDLCITKHLMANITRCICPLSGTYVVMLTKRNNDVSHLIWNEGKKYKRTNLCFYFLWKLSWKITISSYAQNFILLLFLFLIILPSFIFLIFFCYFV